MGTRDTEDPLKGMDWKTFTGDVPINSSEPVVRKRLPPKSRIRQIPECYFLPRRSLPSAIAIYGAICAAGVGAGMLVENWINRKIEDDGGIIWKLDKNRSLSSQLYEDFRGLKKPLFHRTSASSDQV